MAPFDRQYIGAEMNILITGGTGFVGSTFCRLLSDEGHSCICFDLHEPSNALVKNSKVKFIQGDVRDIAALDQAMIGVDAVIHLAAAHHDFGIPEQTFHDVNVGGMTNVCDSMQRHGVKKLCFYSTVALYGKQGTPPTEETTPEPTTPYGATKFAAEKVCLQWCAADHTNQCLVMRPTVIFGPNSFANMYSLIRQIDSGKFLRVGKMTNIKSLAFVDNIVSTSIDLWITKNRPQQGIDFFNYVDIPDLCSRQIIENVYQELGRKKPFLSLPLWLARLVVFPIDLLIKISGKNLPISTARINKLAVADTQIDASKIHGIVDPPTISVTDGIQQMVSWYQAEGKACSTPNRRPPSKFQAAENA